jgi:FkbM family methyltransferase
MSLSPQHLVGGFLNATRLAWFPVKVRHGLAQGAWWTLYPFSAYWRGNVEKEMQDLIAGLGDFHGKVVWDLGAHYGIYSIGLARRTGPTGQVVAFEPNPVSFARLRHHARLNRLGWLKALPYAVSDEIGVAELITYGTAESTTTHLQFENETRTEAWHPIAVPKVRPDDLVKTGEIRPPWFVKVDVEGHGHHAMAGMQQTLRTHRPRLIVAYHSQQEVDGCSAILDPLGYHRTRIETHSGSPDPMIGHDFLYLPPEENAHGR